MLPGKSYTVASILDVLWRRKWLLIVPAVLGLAAAFLHARRLPNQYQAETLILVVPQRVPEAFIRSTVTMRIEDRLRTISQQILSRTRLEQIITELNLYPELRAQRPLDDVITHMRNRVDITIVRGDSFRLAYTYSEPTATMRVVDRLAKDFISDNARERQAQAEGTSQFLEAQLGDARQRLIEQEKRLEEYRRVHAGQLPSQLQSNLQIIQNTQMQLQTVNESLNRYRDRRLVVDRLLSDLAAAESAAPVAAAPAGTPAAQLPVQGQLAAARQHVKELLSRGLTPEHPDVRAAERKVKEIEDTVAQIAAAQPPGPAASRPPVDAARRNQFVQLTAERDSLDRQIAASMAEDARLQRTIAQYQARVEAVPSRESELTELTRDYDTLQTAYRALLAKREESQIATNLENRQIGEQFRMIDPARLPENPISPNRTVIHGAGLAGGLILGFLVVVLLEVRDSSFKTESDVIQVLDLPVLALVPVMGQEQRSFLTRRWLVGAGVIGLALTAVLVAVILKGGF